MRKCGIWYRGTFWLHSEWILNKNTHSAKLKSSASWTFPVKRLRCANSPCVFTVSISTSYLKEMPEPTPSKLWILSFQLSSHHNNEALYSPPSPWAPPHVHANNRSLSSSFEGWVFISLLFIPSCQGNGSILFLSLHLIKIWRCLRRLQPCLLVCFVKLCLLACNLAPSPTLRLKIPASPPPFSFISRSTCFCQGLLSL